MKNLFLILAISTLFIGCSTAQLDNKYETSSRIIGKEYHTVSGHGYQIIEVDGHEYLCMTGGGICPLVRDTVK
jgi:hypothetical protein